MLLLIASFITYGQNRYVVFFTDKGGDENPFSLDRPSEFLTQKSIERRQKQGISFSESDLPVHPEYVGQVEQLRIDVYYTSRWMNAAIIQTEEANISSVKALECVDSLALIAEGTRIGTNTDASFTLPESFVDPPYITSDSELQLAMLQADMMHERGITGENMTIAVLDDGFQGVNKFAPFQHLWTHNRIVASKDFVENSGNVYRLGDHGTSVLSTIAARYPPTNYTGVAYNANFILCITEENGSEDRIEEFNWLLGAEFADSLGADIINSSLSYRFFDIPAHNYSVDDLNGKTAVASLAAKMAADKGMVVVVSAGNSGDETSLDLRYVSSPADAENILTVGSVNADSSYTNFSSIGPTADGRMKPDVAALGHGTSVIRGDGRIVLGSGTSFSAPLITGLAAGVWQTQPTWSSQEVISAIKAAGHNAHDPNHLIGHGVPSYSQAVAEKKVMNIEDILEERIAVYPNPFAGNKLFLKIDDTLTGNWKLTITNAYGQVVYMDSFKAHQSKKIMELTVDNLVGSIYYLTLQTKNHKKVVKLIRF